MKHKYKTKDQLINELMELRQRITELEATETKHKLTREALRCQARRAIATDINERKMTKEALIKINARLQHLLISTSAVIYACEPTSDYATTFMAKNVRTQLGYEPQEFLDDPKFWSHHIHPEDKARIFAELRQLFEKGHQTHKYRFQHKDGTYRWMHDELRLVRDAKGNPLEIVGYWTDITEHKRTEETLRKSEERFRSFLDNLGDAAYTTDSQGNVTYANKMAEKITGVPLEDIIDKPFLPLFTKESQKIVIDAYQKTLNGESSEYEVTLTNGRICHYKNEQLKDKDGKIIGVFGIARNITERKRAEEALQESEEKYRTLIESSLDGIGLAVDGKIVFGSGGLLKMFGYDRLEEVIGKPIELLTIPADGEKIKTRHLKRLRGEITTNRYEFKGLRKDGSIMDIEGSFNTISYQGKPAVLAILRDITENKRMMMVLEESEKKYRSLFKNANDAIFITDMKTGIILDANRQAEKLISRPKEEIIGMHQSKLYPPGCAESYWKFRKHVRRDRIFDFEAGVIKKDGGIVPVFISASIISLRGKEVMQAIFRDITKEKRISNLGEEMAARKLIERAKGMLMNRHKISEKEAMRLLQKESRRQSKKIKEIALGVISSELVLN